MDQQSPLLAVQSGRQLLDEGAEDLAVVSIQTVVVNLDGRVPTSQDQPNHRVHMASAQGRIGQNLGRVSGQCPVVAPVAQARNNSSGSFYVWSG